MNSLVSNLIRRTFFSNLSFTRNIAMSSANQMKKSKLQFKLFHTLNNFLLLFLVDLQQENDTLTVKANIVPSGREKNLVTEYNQCMNKGETFCPECHLGLEIKHTDVLILSQYLRDDGCMLPRRTTRLCRRMQKRITTMVAMAQKAGLMPNINPFRMTRDPAKRKDWKKYNKYFLEETILEPGQKKRKKFTNYRNNLAYAKVNHLL